MTTPATTRRKKIQRKLLIAFAAVVFPPLVFIGAYHVHTITKALEQNAVEAASEALFLKARNIERFLADCKYNLRYLRDTFALRELVKALDDAEEEVPFLHMNVEAEFVGFARSQRIYAGIRFIDVAGNEIIQVYSDGLHFRIAKPAYLTNWQNQEYFIEAMKLMPQNVSVRITRQNLADGSPGRDPRLWYAMPVLNRRRERRGIILTTIFGRHLFTLPQEGETEIGETFLEEE